VSEQKGFSLGLILIIVVVLAVGGYLFYKQNSQPSLHPQQTKQYSPVPTISSPSSTPTASTTPKTTSLNPNTGNLYGDIKVRLNQVIK